MKIKNIVKRLESKEHVAVYRGEFEYTECWMCEGTALIDWVDGGVFDTSAKFADVVNHIANNRSHIYTALQGKRELTSNLKL